MISFSANVKRELCRTAPGAKCCALAEMLGALLYANHFSASCIRIVTENSEFAARLPRLLQRGFGLRFDALPEPEAQGKRVLLCAADTFRAAAADQLEIWADRAGVEIVRSREGADPGAVLFDSLQAAKARNVDVVFCDTAGRLHNKVNLMNELGKLRKIIDRELPDAAKETLLVLDATTGQNGLQQAKVFRETAGLTGIILTKLDGTAKGGICVAIAQELGVPVKYVGLGEGIDDLQPFNAEEYVKALI